MGKGLIRNLKELCAHVGAGENTIESLSRRAYKGTGCGAWAEAVEPGTIQVGSRSVSVRVRGSFSILGFIIQGVSVDGKKVFDMGQMVENTDGSWGVKGLLHGPVPREILDYLCAAPFGTVYRTDVEGQRSLQAAVKAGGQGDGFKVKQTSRGAVVTFDLTLPTLKKHKGGVRVGSIVEGADARPEPIEIFYPFSEEKWAEALTEIDRQAGRLWEEAHGGSTVLEGNRS